MDKVTKPPQTGKSWRKTAARTSGGIKRIAALERLQLEALREVARQKTATTSQEACARGVRSVLAVAKRIGEPVEGCGSTRLGIDVGTAWQTPAIAKLAYDYCGPMFNLQEAATWLAFPERLRRHMAPTLVLTPKLVLIQRRVEVLGPTLPQTLDRASSFAEADAATSPERAQVLDQYERRITDALEVLGFPGGSVVIRRLDNWGVHNGEVVSIDTAEKWRPMWPVWAYLLKRLDDGPVWLDQDERKRLYRYFKRGKFAAVNRPTVWNLAERAGIKAAKADPCPCGRAGPFGDCDRPCKLFVDAALLLEKELTLVEPPAYQPPPRTIEDVVLKMAGLPIGPAKAA